MHTNTQADLKQLILTSWKNRWSEKEWSMHTRTYLHNPSDVFHVADALLAQTYVGTAPNALLLRYLRYGINTGLFSYASVITAISKHEDLHKIETTKGVYRLLHECLLIVNQQCLYEDSMDLCCSLRMILQWLLRNTEQYLKGVHSVDSMNAEELIMLNYQTLKQLTTKPRTSALLTIARFEESGVWSHIETDLAVIKTSAGQHSLHTEISEFCHYVSQLSRCSISPRSVYPQKSSSLVCLPITGLLMLEINNRKLSDPQGIGSQLLLFSQIHGLSISNLLFHTIQTCFLGVIDSVECKNDMEHDWIAMLFLRLPKIFLYLKTSARDSECDSASGVSAKNNVLKFETDLYECIVKLKQLDSLNDTLDQFCNGVNWLKSVVETLIKSQLLTEGMYIQELMSSIVSKATCAGERRCQNPHIIVTALSTVEHIVNSLNPAKYVTDAESLLPRFEEMCPLGSFNPLLASAAACGPLLKSFANKLMHCNDVMKTCSAENNKNAQIRAVIFDASFLMVCHMVRLFGTENICSLNSHGTIDGSLYVQKWIRLWWSKSTNSVSDVKYESESGRVEILLQMLRGSAEFKLNLTKWNDLCSNLPQAVLELIIAKQKGYISLADIRHSCTVIRNTCPLAVSLAIIVAVARSARQALDQSDYVALLEIFGSKSETRSLPLYGDRYALFEKVVGYLAGDLLPHMAQVSEKCKMMPGRSGVMILKDALNEVKEEGWINYDRLNVFNHTYKFLGISAFTRQITSFIFEETRLDAIEAAVDIVYSVIRIDLEAFIIQLLKNVLTHEFLSDPSNLVAPTGPCLAKMLVGCLDLVLNDYNLQKKSLIPPSNPLPSFLFERSQENKQDSMKIRRLLSRSTEHDLASSGSNLGLSSDEPVCVVLSSFIRTLWEMMELEDSAPLEQFVFTFIKYSLYSSPTLSRTVKQFIPAAMAKELSFRFVQDSRELLFAASDLGDPEIRRIAAQAICHASHVV